MRGKEEVFISYSRSHYDEAKKLREQLRNYSGIDAFLDKTSISPGKSWQEVITEAIIACKVCVLMLNKDSNMSEDVATEIGLAHRRHKRIIVVRTENCEPSVKLAYAIEKLQRIEAIPPDDKNLLDATQAIAKALREVKQNLEYPQPSNSTTEKPTSSYGWLPGLISFLIIGAFLSSISSPRKAFPSYRFDDEGTGIVYLDYTGDMEDFDEENHPSWYQEREKITSVIIPETATSIGNFAFDSCTNLKTVEIKGAITRIGENAFSQCALESIKIPDSVTDIGAGAFANSNLPEIEIPPLVTFIDASLFASCVNLSKVEIRGNVTEIGASAFDECKSLSEIHFPHDSVTKIGNCAFRNCTSLLEISGLDNVTKIGDKAFDTCHSLSEISINGVIEIGNSAFIECSALIAIRIPDSAVKIGENAFSKCNNLSGISLPQTFLTNIGANAFPYDSATFTFRPTNGEEEILPETVSESETLPEFSA